jgi:hypothetical protein
VETATTAFIGRALRGPVDEPVICNSYADFQRVFGGLWLESKLGYAVSDFFQNGGSKAIVVRLYNPRPETVKAARSVFEVVKAAANKNGATVDSLVNAANDAAVKVKEPEAAKDAAAAVAKAVKQAKDDSAIVVKLTNVANDAAVKVKEPEAAKDAAAAVAKAVEQANVSGATVADLVKAAQDVAGAQEEGAAQDAANAVVEVVKKAAKDAMLKAAQAAVPRPKASLSVTRLTRAAQPVFEAVAAVDTKEYDGTIVVKLTNVANDAAVKVKEPEAAKDAAAAVAKAVEQANGDSATVASLVKAAQDVAGAQEEGAAREAANAVAKAVEDANVSGATVADLVEAAQGAAEAQAKGAAPDAANAVAQAVIEKAKEAMLKAAQAALDSVTIKLEAAHEGAWGNSLRVRLTDVDSRVSGELAKRYDVPEWELFNLSVRDLKTDTAEDFPNVTVVSGPRRLDQVLKNESKLVRVADLEGAATRPAAHPGPSAGNNWWQDSKACSAADGKATDGEPLTSTEFLGDEDKKTGIYALEHADIFNLLCIPPYNEEGDEDVDTNVLTAAATYCEKRRAMLLVDPPKSWIGKDEAKKGFPIEGLSSNNAAIFFPRIQAPNPLRDNQVEEFAPSGFARTDATRGVWKAPAGQEATLRGVVGLSVPLTDAENGELNPLGINCLRQVPAAGYVVWGARTIVGDDRLASQWKYIPVRRTALYIEESLYRGTQWAVFEPNDEPLWSQLRLNIGVFMHGLFRQGAFQGQSPKDAYFVKCDSTTTTQADIDRGIVNIIVGFAPLKPAEFVVLYIQQIAGQLAV